MVNLLPVANKQNQTEFMQKAMSTVGRLSAVHNANGCSGTDIGLGFGFEYLSNALHHKYCPNRMESRQVMFAILSTD